MKKYKYEDKERQKINELLNIILNLNDGNKYDKLRSAHEEETLKSNNMTDAFPDNLDTFIKKSKYYDKLFFILTKDNN